MKYVRQYLAVFLTFLLIYPVFSQKTLPQLGKNSIKEVIAAMTPQEKVNLVIGTGMNLPGLPLPAEMQGPVVGEVNGKVPGAAGTTFAIPRLGIPSVVLGDGPAGLRIQPQRPNDKATYYCTAFPIGTLLANSWDIDLVKKVGAAMGNEIKEYGVDIFLAPALNNQRNPMGGRNFEYYSEDPVVTGNIAAAYINGVQSLGVGTAIKHFAMNNHEFNRDVINVKANERPIREIYLRSFQIAIKAAKPWTVMSSYNKINGTYASESPELLTTILRNEWKYKGFVMTDWFGGTNAVAQMKAGNDILMPGTAVQQKALTEALQNKTLDEKIVDKNVERILEIILKTPTFKKYPYSNKPNLTANAQISRIAASEGMVLLKNNDNALPLKGKKLAVFGNASYDMIKGGTGSGDVYVEHIVSLSEGLKNAGFSFDDGIKKMYESYLTEKKANRKTEPFMLPPAIDEMNIEPSLITKMANESDAALITIGRNSGEFVDRKLDADFNFTDFEKQLIEKITAEFHAKNKKAIVVLNIGGVVETASWKNTPDAILLAWLPGQEAGNAIVDVLKGKVNPSGKLTATFPLNYMDIPSSANFPGKVLIPKDPNNHSPLAGDQAAEVEYQDGINVGYRFFDKSNKAVSYPFGFGLSYTNFAYKNLHISPINAQNEVVVKIEVENTGKVAGKEVVQIYVAAPTETLTKPAKELRAFAKTKLLQAGEKTTLTFTLDAMSLASFDTATESWIADKGTYKVLAGASVQDIKQTADFMVAKQITVEKVNKVLVPQDPIIELK